MVSVCAICMEPLLDDLQTGTCGHVLHKSCLSSWLKVVREKDPTVRFSCPTCKRRGSSKPISLFLSYDPQANEHRTTRGCGTPNNNQINIVMRAKLMRSENALKETEEKLRLTMSEKDCMFDDVILKKQHIENLEEQIVHYRRKIEVSEARAEGFKLDLINKNKECSELYEKAETFVATEYAESNDLSSLQKLIRRRCGVDGVNNTQDENKYLKALVRQQHKSVRIAKTLTDKYFEKLNVAKKKIKILEDYISAQQSKSIDGIESEENKSMVTKSQKKRKRRGKNMETTTTTTTTTQIRPPILKEIDTSNVISKKVRLKNPFLLREKKKKYSFASGDTIQRKKQSLIPKSNFDNKSSINVGYDLMGGIQKVFQSKDKTFIARSGGSSPALLSKKKKSKASRIKVGVVKNHDSKKSMKKSKDMVHIQNFFKK